ncbi:MAG: hypothetical protein AAF789_13265 [Bacteroidota bacterium]
MSRIFVTIFLSLFTFTAFAQSKSTYPNFSFYDLEGKVASSDMLDRSKPTFIMQFDPYCDHCSEQAEMIAEAAEQFKNVQFVFVTFIPEPEAIKNFEKQHFEGKELDVHFFQDLDFQFETYFGYSETAISIFLYKPGKKQPKFFGKEVPVETLLNYL